MTPSTTDPTLKLVRSDFPSLPEYTPVQPLDILASSLGYEIEELVKLDANENPYGPLPEVVEAFRNSEYLHIYPDPNQTHLRKKLAKYLNVCLKGGDEGKKGGVEFEDKHTVAGIGSDELLELIIKLVDPVEEGNAGEERGVEGRKEYKNKDEKEMVVGEVEQKAAGIIISGPTFGMYKFLGQIAKCSVVDVPRVNIPFFDLNMEALIKEIERPGLQRKILFLASPNNPTGGVVSRSEVIRLCEVSLENNCVVVIDQAYAEFSFEESNAILDLTFKFQNLIILRTFSKWAGLAGLRIGYAAANEDFIRKMLQIKQPYNLTVASDYAAQAALDNFGKIMSEHVDRILKERVRMVSLLGQFPWLKPCPSQSNFVLFEVKSYVDAETVYKELRKKGVLIRYYSSGILKSCIRISAGRKEDTDKLMVAMKQLEREGQIWKTQGGSENLQRLQFDALIFDMDGVLADVSNSYRLAIEKTCHYFGANITQADISQAKLQGNANNDWVLTLNLIAKHHKASTVTLKEVTEKFQEFYLGTEGIPGLRETETLIPSKGLLMEARKRCRYGMSVVTGRPREECVHFLYTHDLLNLFTNKNGTVCLVCMNETKPKPDPSPVLKALEIMEIPGEKYKDVAMLGDTPDDIIAAKLAGIVPLGVLLDLNRKNDSIATELLKLGSKYNLKPGCAEILDFLRPVPSETVSSLITSSKANPKAKPETLMAGRCATVTRKTGETEINCSVLLDGSGKNSISTGLGFLDHMISALSKHSRIDIELSCSGDLHIDDHHSAEDCAIVLGECFDQALGSRRQIKRYGLGICPLDESLSRAVVDISSRPFCLVNLNFTREMIGDISCEMLEHVIYSFATSARICVHVDNIKGDNNHHKAESAFKALAVALRIAVSADETAGIPSTKGMLA